MIFNKKTLYLAVGAAALIIAAFIIIPAKSKTAENPANGNTDAQNTNAKSSDNNLSKNSKSDESVPVSVKVEKVIVGDLIKRVSAYGNAEATRLVKITPETSGKVIQLRVKEGDKAAKNAVLFRLDNADARLKLEQAKDTEILAYSQFLIREMDYEGLDDNRSINIESAKKRLEDATNKYNAGLIPKKEYEQILHTCKLAIEAAGVNRSDVVKSSTGLTSARLNVEAAKLDLQKKDVRAPFDGIVTDIKIVEGKTVGSGEETMTLVDYRNICIIADVLENEISALKIGRKVKIDFLAIEGKIYDGAISAISPLINPEKKTGKVYINIPNADYKIKPGMYARIRLDAHIFGGRLLVPRSAVLERDGKRLVFIIKNGRAQWEYVHTGLENDEYIEIIPDPEIGILGVHEGDIVITDGHFSLAHDVKVKY
jgi:RND family efflux transporter MFP subunit